MSSLFHCCFTSPENFESSFKKQWLVFPYYYFWLIELSDCFYPQGGHSASTHTGAQSKKLSGNSKISLQLHCNPKISVNFLLIKLYMNIKHPESMQKEVRIASSKPRNIISLIFDVEIYHEQIFSVIWTPGFGPKHISFGSLLTPKYWTYLPVYACPECPPLGFYPTISPLPLFPKC